jgi:hypothetical protein
MKLDYQLSDEWEENSIELSAADESELRYNVALGDLLLNSNEVDLSAEWGWVPLLDFALALQEIVNKLDREGAKEVFEFTESGAELRFARVGQKIVISASYADGELKVSPATFDKQIKEFATKVANELTRKYPELKQNKVFKQWKLFNQNH